MTASPARSSRPCRAPSSQPVPLTGQDATPGGAQYILAGWQSGTVYKPVPNEAAAAASVAIDLIKGKPVSNANGQVPTTASREVPSVLLKPLWVTKANCNILFTTGSSRRARSARATYAQYC